MRSVQSYPLPPSVPMEHRAWVQDLFAHWLARFDPRNPQSDFAAGLVANADGSVTLDEAYPEGRSASVVTLTGQINDTGAAKDQRFLPMVNAGGALSTQSVAPLSATADATTASVTIAAHTVQYGFGVVSYAGGTVSGLAPNTRYYVYADDETYQGGAVSYTATTSQQTVTAANRRYFVGAITTALSANSVTITAATSASPIVLTSSTNHGWSTDQQVTFAALPGDFGTALNGTTQTITRVSDTQFSVAVNGSAYTAYTSGGTATRVSAGTNGDAGAGGGWILP